jgi:hypothetical protein
MSPPFISLAPCPVAVESFNIVKGPRHVWLEHSIKVPDQEKVFFLLPFQVATR